MLKTTNLTTFVANNTQDMKKTLTIATICALAVALFTQCGKAGKALACDELPAEPKYEDSTQWYVTDRQANVDIFYIISTETGDYTLADGKTRHHADTWNDSTRMPMLSEMVGVDTLVSGTLNFFSPYYRQCSLQSFVNDSTAEARMAVARNDVHRAFSHYMADMNNGRPFILAGFSQGAMILLDLLKEMDEDVFSRMVAAYAIGICITKDDIEACPHIIPAKGADDTGVTICYNSVRDAKCAMSGFEKSEVAINPVNWKTDATPAELITEPSPLLPVDKQKKDSMTVTLDTTTGLLCVEGYSATDYLLPLIGKEGNYHSREIWLYRDQLRENMQVRARKYLMGREDKW